MYVRMRRVRQLVIYRSPLSWFIEPAAPTDRSSPISTVPVAETQTAVVRVPLTINRPKRVLEANSASW